MGPTGRGPPAWKANLPEKRKKKTGTLQLVEIGEVNTGLVRDHQIPPPLINTSSQLHLANRLCCKHRSVGQTCPDMPGHVIMAVWGVRTG